MRPIRSSGDAGRDLALLTAGTAAAGSHPRLPLAAVPAGRRAARWPDMGPRGRTSPRTAAIPARTPGDHPVRRRGIRLHRLQRLPRTLVCRWHTSHHRSRWSTRRGPARSTGAGQDTAVRASLAEIAGYQVSGDGGPGPAGCVGRYPAGLPDPGGPHLGADVRRATSQHPRRWSRSRSWTASSRVRHPATSSRRRTSWTGQLCHRAHRHDLMTCPDADIEQRLPGRARGRALMGASMQGDLVLYDAQGAELRRYAQAPDGRVTPRLSP